LGVRPFTAAADVWSVGCVAFELLTSSMLFDPRVAFLLFGVGAASRSGASTTRSEETRFDDASSDEAHLAQAMELLGPLP
jgi:serine/threonine protein kinase